MLKVKIMRLYLFYSQHIMLNHILYTKQTSKYSFSISDFLLVHLPLTNAKICSYCSFAWLSFTRSILFCRIRMCFSFIISTAAKCSDVWGCGHDSLPAETSNNFLQLTLHLKWNNPPSIFGTLHSHSSRVFFLLYSRIKASSPKRSSLKSCNFAQK